MLPIATRKALADNRALHTRTFELAEYCRANNITIEPIGAGPFDPTPRLYTGDQHRTQWTITRAGQDPLVQRGEMLIPKQQLRNLRRLDRHGIEFTELLIAHELPPNSLPATSPGWRPLDDFDLHYLHQHSQPPPNQRTQRISAAIGNAIEHTTRTVLTTTRRTVIGQRVARYAAAGLAGAAISTAVSAVAVLDPIIIGTITTSAAPTVGEPASYMVLAQWDW